MKILFLDNDGVICLPQQYGGRYKKQRKAEVVDRTNMPVELRFDDFDKKSIKVLNSILKETDAEIVVSSDWRFHANLEEIGEYYTQQGIIKKPIGFTSRFNFKDWTDEGLIDKDFPWGRTFDLEQERHFEIRKWLKEHPEVTQWVAIDDLNMGRTIYSAFSKEPMDRDWGLENFVHMNGWEGIKQCGKKEKILVYLK
jgi:hypothetical protein